MSRTEEYADYVNQFEIDVDQFALMIKQRISDFLRTPEQAQQLVQLLSQVDWDKSITRERQPIPYKDWLVRNLKQSLSDDAFAENKHWRKKKCICHKCNRFDRSGNMKEWYSSDIKPILLCSKCWQAEHDQRVCTCLNCGQIYLPTPYGRYATRTSSLLCSDCYTPELSAQAQRLSHHLQRAREANTEASLTIPQWHKTLEHFNSKCAYCGGDYECIEHFVPISRGGGTTKDNCVPSCNICNLIKSDWFPQSDIKPPLAQVSIDLVKNYLWAA